MKYAVQASALGESINVGRVNRAGNTFLDKEDHTDMVLAAVAQYVAQNFNGGLAVTFPGLNYAVTIKVEPLAPVTNGVEQ